VVQPLPGSCSCPIQTWRIDPESGGRKPCVSLLFWELKFVDNWDELAEMCFHGATYKMEVVRFACLTEPCDTTC